MPTAKVFEGIYMSVAVSLLSQCPLRIQGNLSHDARAGFYILCSEQIIYPEGRIMIYNREITW